MFTVSVHRLFRSKLFDIQPATSAQLCKLKSKPHRKKRTNQFFNRVLLVTICYEQSHSLLCFSVLQNITSLEDRQMDDRIQHFADVFIIIISE